MVCGSGGSKSRLAKAAGAGPSGEMRWEMKKLRSSTFRSQNVQSTTTTTTTTTTTLHYCCNYKYKYTTLHYATLRYTNCTTPRLQLQLQLHYANYTTLQLQLHHATLQLQLHYTTLHPAGVVRWPLQPLQPLQKTQLQQPVGPSVDSLCHPWFTTTHLSYRFPIFETSATALCGTTGIICLCEGLSLRLTSQLLQEFLSLLLMLSQQGP